MMDSCTGPAALGAALAALINSFPRNPEGGVATIADYTRYTAAGDAPSLFVASPVVIRAGFTSALLCVLRIPHRYVGECTRDCVSA